MTSSYMLSMKCMLVNLKRLEAITGVALRGAIAPSSVHTGPHRKAKSFFRRFLAVVVPYIPYIRLSFPVGKFLVPPLNYCSEKVMDYEAYFDGLMGYAFCG